MNGGIRGNSDEKNCHQYSKVSPNLKAYLLQTEIVMRLAQLCFAVILLRKILK